MSDFQKIKYQLNIIVENNDFLNFYSTFTCHNDGDSGIDLINNSIICEPFQVATIDFNIKCEMIDIENNTYSSYYLVPRSSLANTSFQMANSIGIIDAGYRGNIKAKIRNISLNTSTLDYNSYFQIISPDLKPIKLNIVSSLSTTKRGDGAFGSTK
jgi:dUTP pyrophosphatase